MRARRRRGVRARVTAFGPRDALRQARDRGERGGLVDRARLELRVVEHAFELDQAADIDERRDGARLEGIADRAGGGVVEHEDIDPDVRIEHHAATGAGSVGAGHSLQSVVFV
ncbi:hypothetical protein DM77_3222 [Burkholderia mallei]|nr:hypothetical protein DM77_3222 [Burkholderia mallei]